MNSLLNNEYDSLITSYWFYADILLIIDGIDTENNWLFNNYINLFSGEDAINSIFFDNTQYTKYIGEFFDCPYIQMQKFVYDCKKQINGMDIIDFIEMAIDNGYYILFMVEREYLKCYDFTRISPHPILIHSYDRDKHILGFSDNSSTGKFKSDLLCTYDELKKAYKMIDDYQGLNELSDSVFTFKGIENKNYKLCLNKLIVDFNNYLTGVGNRNYTFSKYFFGIEIYNKIILELNKIMSGECEINSLKGISVLYDHKKIMYKRLKMLCYKYCLSEEYFIKYKTLVAKCEILQNLFIKYFLTKNVNILSKCVMLITQVKNDEILILKDFLGELQKVHIHEDMSENKNNKPKILGKLFLVTVTENEDFLAQFTKIYNKDGTISLKACHHNMYITADRRENHTPLVIYSLVIDEWEKFSEINNDDGTKSFLAINGMFVYLNENRLFAYSSKLNEFTKFFELTNSNSTKSYKLPNGLYWSLNEI